MTIATNDRDLILAGLPPPSPQELSGSAVIRVGDGKTVSLSELASNSLVPSVSFLGEFSYAPGPEIGSSWKQNATYRNTSDNSIYILTGDPLQWAVYLAASVNYTLAIESSNGTVFKAGEYGYTLLRARLFKNGAEVTDETPADWFRWGRSSPIPRPPPMDDATWNSLYRTGYKQVQITSDDVLSRATFFCEVTSP